MTTPTPQARPSAQDVDKVARILMAAWEDAEGKPVTASYVATFADMARAVLVAAEQAAALRALPTGDEALAKAWDEGHRGLCRRHGVAPFAACVNPYLTTPPAQDPSKETDR